MDQVTIRVTWTTEITVEVPECFELRDGVAFDQLPQDWKDDLTPSLYNTDLIDFEVE